MKKIVKLTESDLIKIVQQTKKSLKEVEEPEPVPVSTDGLGGCSASFLFAEGETKFKPEISNQAKEFIKQCVVSSLPTIKQFHNNTKFDLPQLVTFYVGTSSTGSFATNKKVAERRMSYLTDLYLEVMNSFGIREDVAYKLLVQSNKTYTPSKIDRDFFDPAKVKPNSAERICSVIIKPITTKGLTGSQIGNVQGSLIDNSSIINTFLVDNVDEEGIVNGIKSLETYSDIKDLNRGLINARKGTLQNFLNDQLFDDSFRKQQVILHLNKIGKRSGKNTIATIVGPEKYISIILENKKKVTRLTESELFKLIKKIINEETNTLK